MYVQYLFPVEAAVLTTLTTRVLTTLTTLTTLAKALFVEAMSSSTTCHMLSSQPNSPRTTRTNLTFSRNWLIHVANETLDIARDGQYTNRKGKVVDVSEALISSIQNSVHYHSSHEFSMPQQEARFDTTQFYVAYGSSLEIAAKLKPFCDEQQHIGILNSASSKTPSKFLRGTLSQEECICRASLLFPCLAQFEAKPHHFYVINNKPKYQKSVSSCAIFSPKVPVIRCDSSAGELLDEPQECSFVSICAPNAFVVGEDTVDIPKASRPGTNEENFEMMTLKEAMRDRLFRALSLFNEHGCTDLVLCAFGCGVHGSQPGMVAAIFRELLDGAFKGRFHRVVFAIHIERTANFEAFANVFPEAKRQKLPTFNDQQSFQVRPEST
jgi:uncharacterized protein (TIGR02452 family)